MREARGSRLIGRGLRRVSARRPEAIAEGQVGGPPARNSSSASTLPAQIELDLVPGNPVRGFAAESLHLEAFGHAGGFVDRSGGVQVGVFLGHPGLGRDSEVVEAIEKGAALLFGERMRPEAGRLATQSIASVGCRPVTLQKRSRTAVGSSTSSNTIRRYLGSPFTFAIFGGLPGSGPAPGFTQIRAEADTLGVRSLPPDAFSVYANRRDTGGGHGTRESAPVGRNVVPDAGRRSGFIVLRLDTEPCRRRQGAGRSARLLQNGRYAEALEAYDEFEKLPGKRSPADDAAVALGRADCLASQGDTEKAIEFLMSRLETQKTNADLLARRATLRLTRGDRTGADADAAEALKADPEHLPAHWVVARSLELKGELDKSLDAWKWFVDAYNKRGRTIDKDADSLILVGEASEKYYRARARGDELIDSLKTVLSLYDDALKADPNCWQAPWHEARMFLADYNEAKAMPELSRALQINPMAAKILVTLGQADLQGYKLASGRSKVERALKVNPHYAPAYVLLADLNISDERFVDAKDAAMKAVAENPSDEDALARLAASCRLLVDPAGAVATEAVALAANPKPATFYAALGERLADRRKYPEAERAFLLATQADPAAPTHRSGSGCSTCRSVAKPRPTPFSPPRSTPIPATSAPHNQMLVLKHMAAYSPVNTAHFSVLVEPKLDSLIGKYMARYLESVYPELTARFGYEPPNLTKIEIMATHKWFSARTVGLPFIPTVGACTGTVVALASPRATGKPFNWARVLKHEVVHVITLQQTGFNIPHWYTEALAVESEGYPRPQEWNKMLLERVPGRTNS